MCLWKIQRIKVFVLSIDLNAHITNQKSSLVQIGIFFQGEKKYGGRTIKEESCFNAILCQHCFNVLN